MGVRYEIEGEGESERDERCLRRARETKWVRRCESLRETMYHLGFSLSVFCMHYSISITRGWEDLRGRSRDDLDPMRCLYHMK